VRAREHVERLNSLSRFKMAEQPLLPDESNTRYGHCFSTLKVRAVELCSIPLVSMCSTGTVAHSGIFLPEITVLGKLYVRVKLIGLAVSRRFAEKCLGESINHRQVHLNFVSARLLSLYSNLMHC
jgi:hypothetical protein